jgi:hypothetical protein
MLKGALLKLRNQPALEPSKTPAPLLFARSASPLMRERRINCASLCTIKSAYARQARTGRLVLLDPLHTCGGRVTRLSKQATDLFRQQG